jgi:hypothetical protein
MRIAALLSRKETRDELTEPVLGYEGDKGF